MRGKPFYVGDDGPEMFVPETTTSREVRRIYERRDATVAWLGLPGAALALASTAFGSSEIAWWLLRCATVLIIASAAVLFVADAAIARLLHELQEDACKADDGPDDA